MILIGLMPEFDAVVAYALFTSKSLSMGKIIDMLMEHEGRLQRMEMNDSIQVNMVSAHEIEGEQTDSPVVVRGGCAVVASRGRFARSHPQCQICGRVGHLAQKCYYRYDRDDSPSVTMPRFTLSSSFGGYVTSHGMLPAVAYGGPR